MLISPVWSGFSRSAVGISEINFDMFLDRFSITGHRQSVPDGRRNAAGMKRALDGVVQPFPVGGGQSSGKGVSLYVVDSSQQSFDVGKTMRHGMMNRRSRNNNRGSSNAPRRGGSSSGGGVSRSHVFDSNGPEVRIRGTAFQVHEKYVALAKDAASVGDRILAENYLQHAEHYQRVINSWVEMDAPAPLSESVPGPSEGVYASDAPQPVAQSGNPQSSHRPDRQGNEASRSGHRPQYQPRRDQDLGLPPSILGMKPSQRDEPASRDETKKDEFAGA